MEGVDPADRAEAVSAFQAELTRLLHRWPAVPDLTQVRADDLVRPRPGVTGPAPRPGSPTAVGEQAALAVHARLREGTS